MKMNLLPWREKATVYRQKNRLISLITGALLSILVIFILSKYYQVLTDELQNKMLQKENQIKEIESHAEESEEANLKTNTFQKINDEKKKTINQLNEISAMASQSVYFTELSREENIFQIIGVATSLQDLTTLNNHFSSFSIEEIKEMPETKGFQFRIKVTL